ncbi:hypothetical protein BAA13334_I01888 [Brucella abortus A13334]|nr:hypothetical protein BAA13334_I01888 [Brucella abortus A13334]
MPTDNGSTFQSLNSNGAPMAVHHRALLNSKIPKIGPAAQWQGNP